MARLRSLATLLALLWLAVASAAAQQLDPGEGPVVLTADALRYDRDTEMVAAEGNVEISRGARRLLANRVVYAIQADRVEALGDVTLIEPDGTTIFADRVVLTGDLREGFVESVGVIFDDDSRAAADRGERVDGTQTTMERVVYSPCPLCPDGLRPPLWRLRAAQVIHDQELREVIYHHATFELFGVPILYLPYFRHTDPQVDRKSGFLRPSVGSDSELGFFVETPYYFNLAPNRDLTLTPVLFTQEAPLLAAEYRELRQQGSFRLGGTGTYASRDVDGDGRQLRGHIEGDGDFRLDETWNWGYRLAVTTDDTYLRRYDIRNDAILENRLFAERVWQRNYAEVNAYGFQGLRQEDDQGLIPIVLPFAEMHLVSPSWRWGSRFDFDANLVALTRTDGLDTRRLSVTGGWQLPFIGPLGDLSTVRLSLRGDLYHTDGDPETRAEDGTNAVGRAIPRATWNWRWPLAREAWGTQQVLEPVVTASWNPRGLNPDEIPNEDSLDVEFDDTNLFEADRFTGFDRVEEGARVSYGVRFGAYGGRGELVSGLIGQSFRVAGRGDFPEDSGLDNRLSDYVGRVNLSPTPMLDLSYRFRARKQDLRLMRNDLRVRFGPPRLRLDIGYLSLAEEDESVEDGFRERQELTAEMFIGLLPEVSIGARTRRDLSEGQAISNAFGIVYRHPCLIIVGGIERRFTRDRDVEPTTRVTVRLTFQNLGDIAVGAGLLGLGSS